MDRDVSYRVPEIHCEACERSIRGALGKLEGVSEVEIDWDRREVRVRYDGGKTDASQVRERIERAGFDAEAAA